MKKEIYHKIKIPEGIQIDVNGNVIKITGPEGEIEKRIDIGKIDFRMDGNEIILGHKKATKKEKKIINTLRSHIKNMIRGVQKKFEYQLKICFNHFPITVEIKNGEALIKNFLGEKIPRKTKIPGGVEVEVDRDIIKVRSVDKELAGQVAANFEIATKIKKRDRRVFQDGIFIIKRDGDDEK